MYIYSVSKIFPELLKAVKSNNGILYLTGNNFSMENKNTMFDKAFQIRIIIHTPMTSFLYQSCPNDSDFGFYFILFLICWNSIYLPKYGKFDLCDMIPILDFIKDFKMLIYIIHKLVSSYKLQNSNLV